MDLQAFFLTKAGSIALFALFGGLIVLLLRTLYGPRGFFRDPAWDAWNDKETVRAGHFPAWFHTHEQHFLQYAEQFLGQDTHAEFHLRLKIEHTKRVVRHALALAAKEQAFAPPHLCRALLLAALYHDIGRFEQFSKYKTFADPKSCNHGFLACKVLKQQKMLQKETRQIRHLVQTAVCLHNKFKVPSTLPQDYKTVLNAVRDADKLDILHIMEQHLGKGKTPDDAVILHMPELPGQYSPEIFRSLKEGSSASFLDMRCANDFRILLCSWLPELSFSTSFLLLGQSGSLDSIIDGMQDIGPVQQEVREHTKKILKQHLSCV